MVLCKSCITKYTFLSQASIASIGTLFFYLHHEKNRVCFFIPTVPGRALIAPRGRASEARREVGQSHGVSDLRIPGHEVQVIFM